MTYGSWEQWQQRIKNSKDNGAVFFVDGPQAEQDTWVREHTSRNDQLNYYLRRSTGYKDVVQREVCR